MKKTILVAMLATTIFACSTPAEKPATEAAACTSSCVKEGPEVDLINNVIKAYSAGDWTTLATYFADTAKSYHNNDTVAMKMTDRIELFKKLRENIDGPVDPGTPNVEVATVETKGDQYKGYKWGHAWINFKSKQKGGKLKSSLTFVSFAIKDGKILWEQVIYDTK